MIGSQWNTTGGSFEFLSSNCCRILAKTASMSIAAMAVKISIARPENMVREAGLIINEYGFTGVVNEMQRTNGKVRR